MYNSLLDDRCMTLWRSPTGLSHVEGWFGNTLCGRWVDRNEWEYKGLTSIRYLGRISHKPAENYFCKRCASNYRDVKTDA